METIEAVRRSGCIGVAADLRRHSSHLPDAGGSILNVKISPNLVSRSFPPNLPKNTVPCGERNA